MEKEFSSFRKATFGGFNRKDVISYIEKLRNESFEYKAQVEESVKSLNEKIVELENAARLMESGEGFAKADLQESAMPSKESMSDINEATKHLKTVADELCRSLGDFMEKLSRKGLFEKTADGFIAEESLDLSLEDEAEESLVDGILSSLSFLYEGEEKAEITAMPEKEEKDKDVVSDILGGLSFLG